MTDDIREKLRAIKRSLERTRRFSEDTLASWRRACTDAECEIEELLAGYQSAKIAELEKENAELRKDAEIARSRQVVGWLRGDYFVPLPELSKPSDTPVFVLELDNKAIQAKED